MLLKNYNRKFALSLTAAIMAAGTASAYEVPLSFFGTNMPPLDFHGFASQGFLYSDNYNYLGNDTKDGSFKFTEAALNVSMNPFPRTRITAQAFTYDVGEAGKYDVVLDYASAEYTFNDEVGIRAGRIRRPQGMHVLEEYGLEVGAAHAAFIAGNLRGGDGAHLRHGGGHDAKIFHPFAAGDKIRQVGEAKDVDAGEPAATVDDGFFHNDYIYGCGVRNLLKNFHPAVHSNFLAAIIYVYAKD